MQSIKETMEMQTFDSHLLKLYKNGVISLDDALHNSDSPTNLKLKINLSDGLGSVTPSPVNVGGAAGLSLQEIQKEEEGEGEQNSVSSLPNSTIKIR